MCCSSIMSNNPPPGHGGEGPTLGHFHFFHFFFQKCGGMWFYKEIGGMFLCKNTNRRPFGSRKCLNWWIRLKPRGGALIARGLCFYKETYPLFLCKITYRRIFEKKKWEKWKCPRVGPSPPCPGGGCSTLCAVQFGGTPPPCLARTRGYHLKFPGPGTSLYDNSRPGHITLYVNPRP